MSLIDDIRGDFAEVVDGLETVTFRRRVEGDDFEDTEGVTALRRVLERDPGTGGTALAADSCAWHLNADDLGDGVKPKKGDRIKDADDVEWVIGRATLNTFGSRWRCDTNKAKS